MMNLSRLFFWAALVSSLLSCSESNQPAQEQAVVEKPAAATEVEPVSESLPANQGRVVSQFNTPGYSYLEVENGDNRMWIAGNPVQFQDGDVVAWGQAAVMRNFYSKGLDRTFESILFVSDIYDPTTQVAAPGGNRDSQGKVVSMHNAAGYSYLEVQMGAHVTYWLAVPETKVGVGDTVSWQDGSKMLNFNSKSLNRTFDEILFVSGVTVVNQ